MDKILEKITLYSLFVIPIVPLVVTNSLFFPYISGKNFLFRILVQIAFFAWIIWAAREKSVRPKKSWLLIVLILLSLAIVLSGVFGEVPDRSFWSNFERMEGVIGYLHVFAFSIVLMSVMTKERFINFFHTIIGGAIAVAGYGLLQSFSLFSISLDGARVDSTLGNPIYMAAYMLLAAFLVLYFLVRNNSSNIKSIYSFLGGLDVLALYLLYWILRYHPAASATFGYVAFFIFVINILFLVFKNKILLNEDKIAKVINVITFITFTYMIYLTQTRGAILGYLVALVLAAILIIWKSDNSSLKKVSKFGIAVIFILGIIFVSVRDTDFIQSNPTLSRLANISLNDTTTISRLTIWQMGLKGFTEHPVLGWGHENFNIVFNKYYESSIYKSEEWFDRSHSIFVDWLVHSGLVGFSLYVALYVLAIYYLWKKTGEAVSINEKIVLSSLITGYLVQNLFVFDNIAGIFIFISVIAYIHVLKINKDNFLDFNLDEKYRNLALILPMLIFVILMYFVNVKPIMAARDLSQATKLVSRGDYQAAYDKYIEILDKGSLMAKREAREQLMLSGQKAYFNNEVDSTIKNTYLKTIIDQIDKQLDVYDGDARNYVLYASFLKTYKIFDQSLYNLNKAKELSPYKETPYYMSVEIYISRGEMDKALGEAQKVYEFNEYNEESVRILSLVHYLRGENQIADSLLVKRFGTVDTYDDRLLRAYKILGMNNRILNVWIKYSVDHPEDKGAFLKLAELYTEMGDAENAAIAYNKLIALAKNDVEEDPEDISKLVKLFEFYIRSGNIEEARTTVQEALRLTLEEIKDKPREYQNYLSAASFYMVLGSPEEAIKILQQALKQEGVPEAEIKGYISTIAKGGNPWSGK